MTKRRSCWPQDQVRYTTRAVEALIACVWDEDYLDSGRPPRGADTGVRTKADPRTIPDWLLAVADVRSAFARAGLSDVEKHCLRHIHHLGYSPGELSEWWGVPAERVQRDAMNGIQQMTSYLNGEVPK